MDSTKQKVVGLWLQGKCLNEIEQQLGLKIIVDGMFEEISVNLISGNFKVAAGSRDSYFKTVWSLVGSYAFEHINHFDADIACAYESDEMASVVADRITNSIHSYRG
jgi:hypothetical protein